MSKWNEFEMVNVQIAGRNAIIVCPEKPCGKWALKTEYFDPFPAVQIELLNRGYYVAHIENKTRWYVPEDTEARIALAEYMQEHYGVSKKCVIIGMSCGGMQGMYMGALYPDYVSCLYLDAPVVDLLTCPARIEDMLAEFEVGTGILRDKLPEYRDYQLTFVQKLAEKKIPMVLVSGDADSIVPFDENGILLKEAYEKAGCIIETYIKKGGDHHPHSLEDNSPIIDFILKYDR